MPAQELWVSGVRARLSKAWAGPWMSVRYVVQAHQATMENGEGVAQALSNGT